MTSAEMPASKDLLWPTLKALEATGGSASNEELSEQIADIAKLPDQVLEVVHKDGPMSEVDYRAAWARTDLKLIGAVNNSTHGVWALTDVGWQIASDEEVRRLVKEARAERRAERRAAKKQAVAEEPDDADEETDTEETWEETLLSTMRDIDPSAFERLCQRILRESGFTKVEVTGRSGDGGIDGMGVLRVRLLSFHVRFQCKRYAGTVGSRDIRDFRGAMVGRGDKGLFMTTGRFTKDAEREAVRDGAPAIDLIDGSDLCHLLKSLDLGVRTETVEQVTVVPEFFRNL